MTYRTVFEITDRLPDVALGLVAVLALLAMLTPAFRGGLRGVLRQTAWPWLTVGGVLWFLFAMHNAGGQYGLLFGGVGLGLSLCLALLALGNLKIPMMDGREIAARSVTPIAAAAVLMVTGLLGCWQLPALELANRLSAGDVTVTTGVVQNAGGGNWGFECFSVNGHQFCYDDGPSSVGFHQTAANGGPIHDGMQVRVTWIGTVIVRLEIAD